MTLGLASGRVELASDHEAWAEAYRRERARLLEAIAPRILDVRHVGSTSVAGVPAKPILDILIAVESFEEAVVCVEPMERLGYRYRGEHGVPRRHYFVKGDPRTHHVHVVERASREWSAMVRFRALLTSDPEAARAYSEAKERLAATYARDRVRYQREKGGVIEDLLDRALRESTSPSAR